MKTTTKEQHNMKTIYAIRDRIAHDLAGYFPLVVFRTDAQAVRYFGDSMAGEKSAIAAHPDDYELIECGKLDDDGTITGYPKPRVVITGSDLVATQTDHTPTEN